MKKRIIALTMSGLLTVSAMGLFSGCDSTTGGQEPGSDFPTYEDNAVMPIGGWDAPRNTLEDYRFAKEMGLNFMFIDDLFAKRGTQGYADVLGYCEEVGLDAILTLGNAATGEYAKDSWAADTTDYSSFKAVKAINYWDEPYRSNFDRLAELAEDHKTRFGDKIGFFVNHFPNSASSTFGGLNYSEFIKEYCEKVLTKFDEKDRYLSADIYALEERNGTNYVRSNWLNCIETIATYAKEYKAKTNFFIQTTKHYNYRKISEADIRYQFYVNMAFGINGFTYFTYRDSILEGFGDSCVSSEKSCVAHDEYYWAQTVNKEIAAFDHVYLSFDWRGTMPVIGTMNEDGYNTNFDGLDHALESIDCLNAVSATQDALIGQFKDANGNDGLILTNFTDPYDALKNKISLEFKDAKKVRVYVKGGIKDYKVNDNKFEISLNPGEGVFIIPVK